jgi:hypothetical protein
VPNGWSAPDLGPADFSLHRTSGRPEDAVKVFLDMRRAAKDSACTEGPEPGVGATAQALVDDLREDPSLQVSTPSPITVNGLQGLVIDVTLAAGTTKTCPFSSGKPTVPLVVDTVAGQGPYWGIGPGERIRLVVLDIPAANNIVVAIDSANGATFDDLVNATMPLIESFSLTPA